MKYCDSHVKDLSGKISNSLDDSFSVTGITKPNACTETVTFPLHLKTENLTKNKPNYIPWWN